MAAARRHLWFTGASAALHLCFMTVRACCNVSPAVSSVLASIEAVNSKGLEIQVNGPCPTMTLDNVNGCQIYLSEENQNVQIFTSKCRYGPHLQPTFIHRACASVPCCSSPFATVPSTLFCLRKATATPRRKPSQSSMFLFPPFDYIWI